MALTEWDKDDLRERFNLAITFAPGSAAAWIGSLTPEQREYLGEYAGELMARWTPRIEAIGQIMHEMFDALATQIQPLAEWFEANKEALNRLPQPH